MSGDFITAPAIGTRLAMDRIDGVYWPISKLAYGAEDAAVQVSEADPLPTGDAALLAAVEALLPGTGALPAGAATDAKLELIRALLAGVLNVSVSASALPTGAATQATLASVLAKMIAAPATEAKQDAVIAMGTEGYSLTGGTYAAPTPIPLAAGASGPTVTVPRGGYYFFDTVFTGTSPSVKLQRLGADGATWIDVVTRTAIGSGDPIGVPNGARVRVTNAGTTALTGVSAVFG